MPPLDRWVTRRLSSWLRRSPKLWPMPATSTKLKCGAELLVRRAVHRLHHRNPDPGFQEPGRLALAEAIAQQRHASQLGKAPAPALGPGAPVAQEDLGHSADFAAPELAPPRPGPERPHGGRPGRVFSHPALHENAARGSRSAACVLPAIPAAHAASIRSCRIFMRSSVSKLSRRVWRTAWLNPLWRKNGTRPACQSAPSCLSAARCPTPAARCAVSGFVPRAIAGATLRNGFWIAAPHFFDPVPIRETSPCLPSIASRSLMHTSARIRACCVFAARSDTKTACCPTPPARARQYKKVSPLRDLRMLMTEPVGTVPPLTVMTVNTHKGFTTFNRKFILPELRDAVRKVGADVVFLQEVLGTHEEHGKKAQRRRRTTSSWPTASGREFAYGRNMVYPKGHHGNAVMSKFPIVHYQNHDVSIAGPEKRGLLHCVLQRARPRASTCTRSASTWAWPRRIASSSWSCCARSSAPRCPTAAPLIVAGDFNDWRRRAHDLLWREAGLKEVFVTAYGESARTFPGALSAAVAGPHLRAQRLGAPAGRAAAPALVAPVGPRAAGRRNPSVGSTMNGRWIEGNDIRLLENGEEFFPRVFACIANATQEVILETFILFEDKVGLQLHEALVAAAAARRAGGRDDRRLRLARPLRAHSSSSLTDAGVRIHVFDPGKRLLGWRMNVLRRMHRKIVVVDGAVAFVGGINYSADHLADYRPGGQAGLCGRDPRPAGGRDPPLHPRRAGAGPALSARPAMVALAQAAAHPAREPAPRRAPPSAMLVVRDNGEHTSDIERHYRIAIRAARKRVVIANAYFFPGYRFMREMRRAARRGVDVRLILQGEPDMPIVKTAATHALPPAAGRGRAHLRILRAAAARQGGVDGRRMGHRRLQQPRSAEPGAEPRGQRHHPRPRLQPAPVPAPGPPDAAQLPSDRARGARRAARLVDLCSSFLAYHFTRRYPGWASWLPRHVPRLLPALDRRLQAVYPGHKE